MRHDYLLVSTLVCLPMLSGCVAVGVAAGAVGGVAIGTVKAAGTIVAAPVRLIAGSGDDEEKKEEPKKDETKKLEAKDAAQNSEKPKDETKGAPSEKEAQDAKAKPQKTEQGALQAAPQNVPEAAQKPLAEQTAPKPVSEATPKMESAPGAEIPPDLAEQTTPAKGS